MSVVPLPYPAIDSPADRAARLSNAVIATYLAATIWPMAEYTRTSGDALPALVHLIALMAAVSVVAITQPALRRVRDLLPLLLGSYLYVELRWLIPGMGPPHHDALLITCDRSLFGGTPPSAWAPAMPWLAFSELLHLAYASYYAI